MEYRLLKLHRRFQAEVADISHVFHKTMDLNDRRIESGSAEYAVVRLQDAWNNLSRDFILISTINNTVSESGRIYNKSPLGISRYDEMIGHLRVNWQVNRNGTSPRPMHSYWRPKWFRQNEAGKSSQILRLRNRNFSQIINSNTNPIDQIIPIRNFAAHRDKSTRIAMSSAGHISSTMSWSQPADIVRVKLGRIPDDITIFDEWAEKLIDLSYLLAVS